MTMIKIQFLLLYSQDTS